MKFNNTLKTILISNLIFCITFGRVAAIENISSNIIKINFKDVKGRVLFTRSNNEIDSNVRLYISNFVEEFTNGFKVNILCYRLDNLFELHPMFKYYLDLAYDLELIITNLNNEVVYQKIFDNCDNYVDEDGKFVDSIEISDLLNIQDGTYNLCLFYGENYLGSFNFVELNRKT